jgi:shikimate dehydrogenase
VYALLGDPVAHSLSPAMHNAAIGALGLDAVYVPLRCSPPDVPGLIRGLSAAGGGGNVTVPHKEVAAASLQQRSDRVAALGACNTFWGTAQGTAGENTDVDGILAALTALEAPPTRWLVAGTGGGARAVIGAARVRGASIAVRSRDPARRRAFESWVAERGVLLAAPAECDVLINATPLGLHSGDHLPLAVEEAPQAQVAFDMVYAHGETAWVRLMRHSGLRAADGRSMLVAQGAAAFRRWFPDEDPPTEIMRAVVDAALR